ncbi:MAG: hypothetical protein KDJ52_11675 [Anaerolineae bacterium]|nr:hypothetical protein [Anaerolineae bacterium]
MEKRKPYLYRVRGVLDNPFLWIGLAITAGIFVFIGGPLCVAPFIVIIGVIVLTSSLIGRRCPNCGGRLKQMEGRLHPGDQRVVQVIWRCLADGYEEIETSRYEPDEGGFF